MNVFAGLEKKLETNVYQTLKGLLRLQLLHRDIVDFCPPFSTESLTVLDVGGGAGHFARICAEYGHKVLLCDASREMLQRVEADPKHFNWPGSVELLEADFLAADIQFGQAFDLVAMHGSAEWMAKPEQAIEKACSYTKPGGYFSLLIFNKDRQILQHGINGQLLVPKRPKHERINNLTPPGARSPSEILELLDPLAGRLLLQSGIRVFHRFFRELDDSRLTPRQWLEQEVRYYRTVPFSSLGVHTHFIWQAESKPPA